EASAATSGSWSPDSMTSDTDEGTRWSPASSVGVATAPMPTTAGEKLEEERWDETLVRDDSHLRLGGRGDDCTPEVARAEWTLEVEQHPDGGPRQRAHRPHRLGKGREISGATATHRCRAFQYV
ncbi:hypothetical protein AWZ03_015460, partial [Drosophila navojoa]